jgi:hypothetical protein
VLVVQHRIQMLSGVSVNGPEGQFCLAEKQPIDRGSPLVYKRGLALMAAALATLPEYFGRRAPAPSASGGVQPADP